MNWRVPRIWEGGDVWIIGGGPSVPKQFNVPDDIIKKVVGGSSPNLYSPFMSAIHTKHVIGINVAYLIGTWMDMVFFGDKGFFLTQQKGLGEFPGLKVACHPTMDDIPWVKNLERDRKRRGGISDNPGTVCWNKNSGAAAISVAANAGAKRIILLGFDMKLADDKGQHWHDIYGKRGREPKKGKPIMLPFDRHLRGFPEIAKDAKHRGIEIINVSPDSAITCFRKATVEEVL